MNGLGATDLVAQFCHPAIDRNPPLPYPVLDLAAGTHSGSGKEFLQAFSHGSVTG
jgi:hypothetical protein